jgi:hypothetical protein
MHTARRAQHPDELSALEKVTLAQIILQPFWPPAVNLVHKSLQERLNISGRLG